MKLKELAARADKVIRAGEGPIPMARQKLSYRMAVEEYDDESRTVRVSFSSEHPVRRWWGVEVLGHKREEIEWSRIKQGLPVLDEHGRQIGICDDVKLRDDGKMEGVVRFGSSERALETYRDVRDDIRRFTSVGYENLRLKEIPPGKLPGEDAKAEPGTLVPTWDGPKPAAEGRVRRWFRSVLWMPHEFSFVSVPADPTVGSGRSEEDVEEVRDVEVEWLESRAAQEEAGAPKADPANDEREETVKTHEKLRETEERGGGGAAPAAPKINESEVREQAAKEERKRVNDILAAGQTYGFEELARTAVEKGVSLQDFRDEVWSKMDTREAAKHVEAENRDDRHDLGMPKRDMERYSLREAMLAVSEHRWKDAGVEREAHEALVKRLGEPKHGGILIPLDIVMRKTVTANAEHIRKLRALMGLEQRADFDTTTGNDLVGTVTTGFIDLLRNATQVMAMGCTVMSGLRGNISIPKLTTGTTAFWLAEGDAVTDSSPATGVVTLQPHTVAAKTHITRRLLLQSTPAADMIMMMDLALTMGIEKDRVAIEGTGLSNQPLGILDTPLIGDVAIDTAGGPVTFGHIVDLETELGEANANIGQRGYLISARGAGALKATGRKDRDASDTASSGFVLENGMMNGYPTRVSNNVPDDLAKGGSGNILSAVIFGNWNDLLCGEWGTMEIKPDPYTEGDRDELILRTFHDCDFAVRHPESFAAIQDANFN